MEKEEMLEQTNETENVETQTTEENVEGIDLTDTTESAEEIETEEEKQEVKSLKDLLKENPQYQEQFNTMIKSRLDRKDRDYQKELSKYKNIESVLNKGLGVNSLDEADQRLRSFYKEQGINIPEPQKPGLSDKELEILGSAEADEIIELGLDAAEEEANKLAQKGHENWNTKERATFAKLASTLNYEKQKKELKTIGADVTLLDSKEFKDFAKQFQASTDVKTIYNLYSTSHKSKEKNYEKMGSMKNNPNNNEIKDFYTYEESLKFTKEDFDKNPKLFEAVERSMLKW